MIRLPSLVRTYDAYYSKDPALKQAPEHPGDKATDEQLAEYKKAREEYAATLEACQETGEWGPLLIEGQTPLKFVLGQIDGNHFRALVDRLTLPDSNPRHVGHGLLLATLLRLALRDVVGAEGVKIDRAPDPEWDGWVMAQPSIITVLDMADLHIVTELGALVYRRSLASPKRSKG